MTPGDLNNQNTMNAVTANENKPVRETLETERENLVPDVNIYEKPEEYVLEAEMPGVSRAGLEVILENSVLTIVGRRSADPLPGNALYRESRVADFRRSFEIDPLIDAGRINARLDQGLLTLRLPKVPQAKPRRIAIAD